MGEYGFVFGFLVLVFWVCRIGLGGKEGDDFFFQSLFLGERKWETEFIGVMSDCTVFTAEYSVFTEQYTVL